MQSHEYSVVGHSRSSVGRYIGSIAAAIASGLAAISLGLSELLSANGAPELLSKFAIVAVPAATVYTITHWCFNKFGWRALSWFSQIPNIDGTWDCIGQTMNDAGEITFKWTGVATISQSWEKIRVHLSTGKSQSNSVSAALIPEPDGCWLLMYSYRNEPRVGEVELHSHVGYCEMRFAKNLKVSSGDYFNAKGRGSFGRMLFKRKE